MKLPSHLVNNTEWTILGPMGPKIETTFLSYSLLGVDGGARFTPHLDVWVGDQDSLIAEPKASYIFRHGPEKDHSDLNLALSLFTEKLPYCFHLWGFLGGRKDHELFNLGEVSDFLNQHPKSQAFFYNEQGKKAFHFMAQGSWKFSHHGTFSLGALKETILELKGLCHYPIPSGTLLAPLSSLGLSNEGKGEIELNNQSPVFLYFPENA